MPPKTYGRSTSSSSSGPSSKSVPSRSTSTTSSIGGGGKKMSSLSSLQSTLKFTLPPSFKSGSASNTAKASSSSSSSASSSKSASTLNTNMNTSGGARREDREMMPPPPADYLTKTRAKSRSASPEKPASVIPPARYGNGKGKRKEEVIDSDDDEIEITGSSPKKIRKGDGLEDMWTELYAPETIADLAPGKARVAKVRSWIHEAIYGYPPDTAQSGNVNRIGSDKIRKYKRILLLSGPAGAGKTTTVRVVAKEMGVELMEWGEGADDSSIGAGVERESSTAKLISFLSRNSYSPLNIRASSQSETKTAPRLILLTGLPNLSHHPTREAFHAALLAFCQSFSISSCPMIIVHSDAGSGGRAEESWMERDRGGREGSMEVLGRAVKDGPWCQEIDFIPIAHTFITKALKAVVYRHMERTNIGPQAKYAGSSFKESSIQLIAATCNGDLRSAINSLQMLRSGGLIAGARESRKPKLLAGTVVKGRGSKGGKGARIDADEGVRAALDALTRKEQNLGLFHALGKILYNKRLGDPGEDKEDQEALTVIRNLPAADPLPDHLSDFERRRSLIQIEEFLPTIPVDTSSLALWLHECTPKFIDDIDQATAVYEDLCRADIMRADDDIWQASPQAIAYALHITVRGTLMALPSPVPRKNQKVTKPQFFESYKAERDNIFNLDIASAYITKKAVVSSIALSERPLNTARPDGVNEIAWGGLQSRYNLAVEMVPMMIKIQNASGKPLLPSSVQKLALPPYSSVDYAHGMEIDGKTDMEQGDDFEESTAGEDGLGVISSNRGVWDEMPDLPEEKEEDGAEGDEIEDWD